MWTFLSRSFVKKGPHRHLSLDRRVVGVVGGKGWVQPLLNCTLSSPVASQRWQHERCGAGCGSRLAYASWLASQFGARQCSHATAKLHNAALHKVHVQSVASSLCVPAPLRAPRVYAAGVMQNCLRWSGRQSSALPGRFAPYAPPPVALVVCWRCGLCQALHALFWSAALRRACCVCPRPPLGLACFAASPARSARQPPKWAPLEPRHDTPLYGGCTNQLSCALKRQVISMPHTGHDL